jgi:hypothetical protein
LVLQGLEFRALCLLGKHFTTLATSPVLFSLRYFSDRVLGIFLSKLAWTTALLFMPQT